jgi:hypothetical protein
MRKRSSVESTRAGHQTKGKGFVLAMRVEKSGCIRKAAAGVDAFPAGE